MGCRSCPDSDKNQAVDKHGNPVERNPVIGQAQISVKEPAAHKHPNTAIEQARELTYAEYIAMRNHWRAESKLIGQEKIQTFTEDYKRIQLEELVSVYNLDEVHFKLSPTQALSALYEFANNSVYDNVFSEFEGLKEQIIEKFEEFKKNRITLKWKG